MPTNLSKTAKIQDLFAIFLFFTGSIVHATVKMASDKGNSVSLLMSMTHILANRKYFLEFLGGGFGTLWPKC